VVEFNDEKFGEANGSDQMHVSGAARTAALMVKLALVTVTHTSNRTMYLMSSSTEFVQ